MRPDETETDVMPVFAVTAWHVTVTATATAIATVTLTEVAICHFPVRDSGPFLCP